MRLDYFDGLICGHMKIFSQLLLSPQLLPVSGLDGDVPIGSDSWLPVWYELKDACNYYTLFAQTVGKISVASFLYLSTHWPPREQGLE